MHPKGAEESGPTWRLQNLTLEDRIEGIADQRNPGRQPESEPIDASKKAAWPWRQSAEKAMRLNHTIQALGDLYGRNR